LGACACHFLLLAAFSGPLAGNAASDEDPSQVLSLDDFNISLWNKEATLKSGAGYSDNVTLRSEGPTGSAFWNVAADVMVFRLPTKGWTFSGFASFDHVGYVDQSAGVDNAQTGLAMAQLSRELGTDWKSGVCANYLYQHQILDLSTTQTNPLPNTEVRGHALSPRWFLRRDSKPCWFEAEVHATRQWLAEPLDSYWSGGPRLSLGRTFVQGSELRLIAQGSRLDYDSREQVSSDGFAETNTSLRLFSHGLQLAWDQVWDDAKRWHTGLKAGMNLCRDNGSGFFDFKEYQVAAQIRFESGGWMLSPQIALGYYQFPVQTISSDDLRLREKISLSAGVQAERALGKHLSLFASYRYDGSPSNASFDRYAANTTILGFQWRF
jgi:hypothetical protein